MAGNFAEVCFNFNLWQYFSAIITTDVNSTYLAAAKRNPHDIIKVSKFAKINSGKLMAKFSSTKINPHEN